jgi:hypothetical protein
MESLPTQTLEPAAPLRSLGELLALSLSERRPIRASWLDPRGEHEIYIDHGEVMHARYGDVEGPAAVFRMLDCPDRRYRIEVGRLAPRRSVIVSWARLCHDARCDLLESSASLAG